MKLIQDDQAGESRPATPGRWRVVAFVALQLAPAGAPLVLLLQTATGVGLPLGLVCGAITFFTLAWLRHEERGMGGARLVGLSLLAVLLATVGWFFFFAVVYYAARSTEAVGYVGMVMAALLGPWTAGSMALLQIPPFVPRTARR